MAEQSTPAAVSAEETRGSTPAKRDSAAVAVPAAADVTDGEPSGFENLGLSSAMLDALRLARYSEPTPVQAGTIPRALAGVDVMAQARTGTGKTAAFAIPILERLEHRRERGPQALVLVPTRELAVQVNDEFEKLSYGTKAHVVAVYGGKPIRGQINKLSRGVDVVVGTPGRVLDHMHRGTLDVGRLKCVVLDEADRMLDIGFRPDIEKILRRCPASRQSLLFSATVPPPVEKLALRYMREPETLNFSSKDITVETIDQFYFTVDRERKFDLLIALLEREQPQQAIVFCRTKRMTDKLYQKLSRRMKSVDCIHGDLPQGARDRVMGQFRNAELRLLVATDVVGRGIDVSGISHIINYDIPEFCDDYVHRVGRTGRMGRQGVAFTFVAPEEGNELTRIEMRINRLLERAEIQGFQVYSTAAATGSADAGRPDVINRDGDPPRVGAEQDPAAPPEQKTSPPRPGQRTRRYRRAL